MKINFKIIVLCVTLTLISADSNLGQVNVVKGKSVSPIKDTTLYNKLELAEFYENLQKHDNALKLYYEELNSKNDSIRKQAFNHIKKIEEKNDLLLTKVLNKLAKIFDISLYLFLCIVSLILLLLLIYFAKILQYKFKDDNKIILKLESVNSSGDNEHFNDYIAYTNKYISQLKYLDQLKEGISKYRNISSKPSFRVKELSPLAEIAITSVVPQLGANFKKIVELINFYDFKIENHISFVDDNNRNVLVFLKDNKRVIKVWEKSVGNTQYIETLKSLSYEVLSFIENIKTKSK